jgi:hypothetical protein
MALSPFFNALAGAPSPGNGPAELRFRNAGGILVGAHALSVRRVQDYGIGMADLIAEIVDVPLGWTRLELFDGGNVVQTWDRSPNPPQVLMQSPQSGFHWTGRGTALVEWSGLDPDQDSLTYRVLGTFDGQTFHVLAGNLQGTSVEIDLASIPGSGVWSVAIEASDGFDCSRSAAATGWVAPKAPQPLILAPRSGQVLLAGEPDEALGLAADWEDDAAGDGMTWVLDGQPVATGPRAELQGLGIGVHVLELRATNLHNLSGSMTVQFSVAGALQVPQPTAPQDGSQGLQPPIPLQWTGVPGATSYRVQTCPHPGFEQDVIEAIGVTAEQISLYNAQPGRTYYWRVRAEQGEATSDWSATFAFSTMQQPAGVLAAARLQTGLRAHPNPFNPRTTLQLTVPRDGAVSLAVYDLAGRRVRTLVDEVLSSGPKDVVWDGLDEQGRRVGSGVYLVRMRAGETTASIRVALLK